MHFILAGAALLTMASLSCVSREHNEVKLAREAYDQCVAEHSASYPGCVSLRDRLLDAQRRYRDSSRRAWGCDPAQEQCPTPR